MYSTQTLPENYKKIFSINLQTDKKKAFLINGLALIISAVMAVPMLFYKSITSLFDMSQGLIAYTTRFAVLLVSLIAYIILHELVHGITMKLCGTKKVKYGFTGLYAFAGSEDYYDKKSYIAIALAPVIVWGIIIAIINIFVQDSYFWVVYLLQIMNISGAAGDFYVTARFSKMPKDILVKDSGVGMTVYSAER